MFPDGDTCNQNSSGLSGLDYLLWTTMYIYTISRAAVMTGIAPRERKQPLTAVYQ